MRLSSVVLAVFFSAMLCASAQISPSYTSPAACKATLHAPITPSPQMSQYAADRNNAMATARLAFNCRDYEASYQLYLKVLGSYPNDAAALVTVARAAVVAGHDDEAIALYKRSIQPGERYTYSAHTAIMQIDIRLGRWDDFQAERLDARAASLAGKLTMSRDQLFQIDELHAPQEYFDAYDFATLGGSNHTRDRFDLREEKDICTNFTPYIDLAASDSVGTTYSLQAFPTPTTHWLIKTYPKGEPPYQTVRADVLSAMNTPLTTFKPPAPCRTPAPTATNGGLSATATTTTR